MLTNDEVIDFSGIFPPIIDEAKDKQYKKEWKELFKSLEINKKIKSNKEKKND